jgi:hypothetical protein
MSSLVPVTCESCINTFHVKPYRMRVGYKPRFWSVNCRQHSNDPARFWKQVEKRGPDDCWPWRGDASKTPFSRLARQ